MSKVKISINSEQSNIKERTLADVKRRFQKTQQWLKTMEGSEMPSPFRKENT